MIWDSTNRTKVFVVDADSDGYEPLTDFPSHQDVVFFRSGREALRTSPDDGPAMWVINVDLPDMRGIELRSMLQSRGNQSPLALISNEYSVEDEIAARSAGAEMYFAKPLVSEVIAATV